MKRCSRKTYYLRRAREDARRKELGLGPAAGGNSRQIKPMVERLNKEDELGLPHLEEIIRSGPDSALLVESLEEMRARLSRYRFTDEWKQRRGAIFRRDENQCAVCARHDNGLHAHHLTYDRVFRERKEDLVSLCRSCHQAVHYDEAGRRRKDWKSFNPPPVLPKEGDNAS